MKDVDIAKVLSKAAVDPYRYRFALGRVVEYEYTCLFKGETEPRTVPEDRLMCIQQLTMTNHFDAKKKNELKAAGKDYTPYLPKRT